MHFTIQIDSYFMQFAKCRKREREREKNTLDETNCKTIRTLMVDRMMHGRHIILYISVSNWPEDF